MAWDFSTDPEFQAHLDWMRDVVREEIWPLETLSQELEWEQLMRALEPVQEQVKERGLWAAHLDPELGGQGFGQVKLGLMHEILGTSPLAPFAFGNAAPDSGNSEILALAGHLLARPTPDGTLPSTLRWCESTVQTLSRAPLRSLQPAGRAAKAAEFSALYDRLADELDAREVSR